MCKLDVLMFFVGWYWVKNQISGNIQSISIRHGPLLNLVGSTNVIFALSLSQFHLFLNDRLKINDPEFI